MADQQTPTSQHNQTSTLPSSHARKWPGSYMEATVAELRIQRGITLPLVAMNLAWFSKVAITTAFLGRLGELELAGGSLGFTFANVTGFALLNGLSNCVEPICGQAFGAKNAKLMHKTLLMAILMLLVVTVPISFMWLNVDKILLLFGQREDIASVSKTYLFYLLPDLIITSLLCPVKSYLNAQGVTVPTLLCSALALGFHVPVNIFLARSKGLPGVAMAIWISDLAVVVPLIAYVYFLETGKDGKWSEGGWFDQGLGDWVKMVKLSGPCCLTLCLEWWCYEILVLLSGRLHDPRREVGVITIVLNFDYLTYSVMLSIATCVSVRVANELGANKAGRARRAAYVSMGVGVVAGTMSCLVIVAARRKWGSLFSRDRETVRRVEKTLLLLALIEIVNFPLAVCGGVARGTARLWLAMGSFIGGFYLVALPLGVVLAFKVGLGLGGLFIGFLMGIAVCFVLVFLGFFIRIDWDKEASKAQLLASVADSNGPSESANNNGIVV